MPAIIPLMRVSAEVESANDPTAVRFEYEVFQQLLETDDQTPNNATATLIRMVETINKCSPNTARQILVSSYGKLQFLGSTLYGLGYAKPIISYWSQESEQEAMWPAYMRQIDISPEQQADASWLLTDSATGLRLARLYNGPGDPVVYYSSLMKAYTSLVDAAASS